MGTTVDRLRPWRPVLVLLCALALVAAGCSESTEGASATMRSGERPEEPVEDTEVPSTEEPGTSTTTTAPSDGGEGEGDAAALCASFEEFSESGAGEDPESMLEALDEWRSLAPPDLQDDLDAVEDMVRAIQALDKEDPDSLGRVLDTLLDPSIREAVEAIGEFSVEECGIDLGTGSFGDLQGELPGG